jgi:hypothetical protein
MSARAAILSLALLACAARAHAAVIEGRVSHPSKPGATAHIVVEALGLDKDEHTISRQTQTDAEGRYRFDDLPSPAAYLVRAHYGGLTFPGGSAAFRGGEEAKRETLDFKVYEQTEDGSQLRLSTLQWVIARSAAVWRIQISATVSNPSDSVVITKPTDPAPIGVGLPAGHGELETFFGRLPEGVVVRNDVAEIRGPVFPGDEGFTFQVEFDLEQPAEALATELRAPSAIDNVAVYVQDFGVDVDAGELHPARPARENDQTYQSFIGFDIPAGTPLPIHVNVLPPASRVPMSWVAVLAALGAGLLLFFVAAPVVREALARDSGPQESLEPESPAKAALAAALHDLEHDFETGKLSVEDRERLREDLRREALGALARERLGPAPAEPEAERACSCGRVPAAGDRFCAACGKAL